MQAIGSYEGGRMLFLGLGTGLGAAMIVENVAQPMELAHLPYKKGRSFEDYLGDALKYKSDYDYKLGTLMDYYEIKTEAEILVATF